MDKERADLFYNWLSKPIPSDEVDIWYKANNIIPEYTDLFKDFCLSFYYLVKDTYLGDPNGVSNETTIGLTQEDKGNHFEWCWKKTIDNFKKENIIFDFEKSDYDYFNSFFFEVYYNQESEGVKNEVENFFKLLFDRNRPVSKSDIEMFTDVYKSLERALQT